MSLPMRWTSTGHQCSNSDGSSLAVAGGGDVVGEGVEPHPRHRVGVPGEGHAPLERAAADGDVPQAAADEREHLVAAAGGDDRLRVLVVPVEQPLLVAGEPEEPVVLLHPLHRPPVDGAVPVDEVVLGVIGLAADAVQALVGVALDVAVVEDGLEELLHRDRVAGLGGADEVVVGHVEQVGRGPEAGAVGVGQGLGVEALGVGRLLVLQPVLVGAGDEAHVVAQQPVPPGDGVADDDLVGVADVGRVVDVADRRREVEALGHDLNLPTGRFRAARLPAPNPDPRWRRGPRPVDPSRGRRSRRACR